ncbi:hypothetical protein [Streptomyces sp. WMMC897]|uniref:hypothetical protein n=1 Tax=Streptomyces sp. WMMC897 TaxID=3014782 RepID=UPI0022B62515|nr:hypothetical protein [Streptomyces sp. WMMC897]MCZ7416948.1 hypothetical protein [Streptomyces sp. WMMC897]
MPAHARPRTRHGLRAALTVTAAAAAALGAASGSAQADVIGEDPVGTAADTAGHVLEPVTALRPYALAGTGVDPLDNAVGAQIADFKPVSTAPVAAPVTQGGASLDSLTAPVTNALGG